MKLSEVLDIILNYESAKWSPSRMEVKFGCDCGCGGDSYTIEQWQAEELAASEAIRETKELCDKLGIEYDGIE
jgi:hypothetical protein